MYNEAAVNTTSGRLASASSIIAALRPIHVDDREFKAAFAAKQLRTTNARNRRVVRYILLELERQVSGRAFDSVSEKHGIEHVLPERPGDGWDAFADDQVARCVYRLGNMAMLASTVNRSLGNATFSAKREADRMSDFELTRRIADQDFWTEDSIEARQQELARLATAVWRSDEID